MSNKKRVTQLRSSARRGQSRQNHQRQDPQTSDIRGRIRHNEGRESTPFLTGKSFCVYVLPKFTDAMPQLKELSLYFTASPHRPRYLLSGAAVHPSTQLAKTARWGTAVLHGGEPRGPRRVGCQRIISQARDVPPPGFRTADDAANPSDPFGPQWV